MPAQVFGTDAVVLQLNQAFRGTAPSNSDFNTQKASVEAQGQSAFAISFGAAYAPANAQSAADFVPLANTILANLNLTVPTVAAVKAADLAAALPQLLFAFKTAIGQVILNLTNILTGLEGDANWGVAAAKFNQQELVAHHYSSSASSTTESPIAGIGQDVMLTAGAASVNEGGAASFTVNGAANTEYGYKIEGVQAADISGATVGFVKTNANGVATFSVVTAADRLTEGAEAMKVSILNHGATTVTVVDTSLDNVAPVITAAATLAAQEDVAAAFSVSTTDAEGDAVTVTATAANGTVVSTGNGTFAYTGKANFNGADTITVTATDALGAASTQTVAVTVAAVNDAPVITAAATLAAAEEVAALFNVSTSDVDGDTVTVTATAANGTVVNNGNGTFSYTGNANFAGSDTITVVANDGTVAATQTIAVTVANVNDAPVAAAATAAANEAGPLITGQLVATDADAGDTLTYTLNAPVAGLTLNANGFYDFNPAQNPAAQALVYSSAPLSIVANYTATDAAGATSQSALTITVTPTPLTYTLTKAGTSVEEGSSQVYTVTASEALTTAANVVFTLLPGEGTAANAGTGNTNTVDFATGSFNPVTATIGVGQTTAAFTVNPSSDAITELPESFTVQAVVAGQTLSLGGTAVDATTTGGVGQTFTLTTGVDTIPGLIGSANSAGTDGNDIITGTLSATASERTISALDTINGGLGTNEFRILDLSGGQTVLPSVTVANIQNVTARSVAVLTLDTSAWTGVTSLSSTTSTDASLTAAATTAISVTGATGDITINGGMNIAVTDATADKAITIGGTTVNAGTITVTDSKVGTGAIAIDGGTNVTLTLAGSDASTIKVGDTTAGVVVADMPTGVVSITSTSLPDAPADKTLSAITAVGGSTITVTQTASSTAAATDTTAQTITQGAVAVTGSTATTSVTVAQTKAVTAVNAVTAVAGSVETASVKFGALVAGDTLTLDANADNVLDASELTLKATVAMTAAEVAAAFASLISGTIPTAGDTQSGAAVAKGTYAGAATLWTSAAASGDTVAFTSTTAVATAGTNVTNLAFKLVGTGTTPVVTTTDGVNKVDGKTGVLGVVNGAVVINDNATAASVKTISVNGYATGSTIGATNATTVLDTLTLKNAAGTASMVVADTAATLALTVEGLGTSTADAVVTLTAAPTTLNVTSTGANYINLTAAATETLAVAGTGLFDVDATDLAALKTVTVSGSAGLKLNAAVSNTVTSVNTSATTGAVTVTIDGAAATYTGGAGVDTVTLATSTALTKAIDLGAGDDTLTLVAATTGSTALLSGGDGTDTLSMTVATAEALDGAAQSFYTNFERLTLNDAGGAAPVIDLANLGFTNYVTTTGSGGTLTLNNLASNGTVVITTAPTTGYTIGVKDAATGGADVANVKITSAAAVNAGVLTVANVETINIESDDTNTTAHANSLTLTADKATTLNVTGDAGLTLTALTGSNVLATINASTSTGVLTATGSGQVAMTITGGSKADVLTASVGATAKADVLVGGAGDDTLNAGTNGATLTGGAGNDLFVLGSAVAATGGTKESNTYSAISDFAAGDLLQLKYNDGALKIAESFAKLTAVLDPGTAVFSDYVNAAMSQADATSSGTAGDAVWFMYGGNSYVVVDSGTETTGTFTNGEDLIIKLTGVDLTNASFNTTWGTVALG